MPKTASSRKPTSHRGLSVKRQQSSLILRSLSCPERTQAPLLRTGPSSLFRSVGAESPVIFREPWPTWLQPRQSEAVFWYFFFCCCPLPATLSGRDQAVAARAAHR